MKGREGVGRSLRGLSSPKPDKCTEPVDPRLDTKGLAYSSLMESEPLISVTKVGLGWEIC